MTAISNSVRHVATCLFACSVVLGLIGDASSVKADTSVPIEAEASYLPDDVEANYIQTPDGNLTHRSCVFSLTAAGLATNDWLSFPSENLADHKCRYRPRAKSQNMAQTLTAPVDLNATISWNAGQFEEFRTFSGSFTVPNPPLMDGGQLLYVWSGLERGVSGGATQPGIIQPVLQWGTNISGSGSFWAIANWVQLTNGTWGNSPTAMPVSTGDVLNWKIDSSSCDANGYCNWSVRFTDVNNVAADQWMFVPRQNVQYHFTVAILAENEFRGMQYCSEFPNTKSETFTGTLFGLNRLVHCLNPPCSPTQITNPPWVGGDNDPLSCGDTEVVNGPTSGTLTHS